MGKVGMMFARNAILALAIVGTTGGAFAAQHNGQRLTPAEMTAMGRTGAGTGTSGIATIQMTVLSGNPAMAGLYTIRLTAPPNTRIEAHSHRDTRSAVVVSGTWYFGYGPHYDESALKLLPAGSFYTEPGGVAHFAQTRGDSVTLIITGYGPSDTVYVDPAHAPPAAR
jgi:uncharacterized RmlC-like cupin family protein